MGVEGIPPYSLGQPRRSHPRLASRPTNSRRPGVSANPSRIMNSGRKCSLMNALTSAWNSRSSGVREKSIAASLFAVGCRPAQTRRLRQDVPPELMSAHRELPGFRPAKKQGHSGILKESVSAEHAQGYPRDPLERFTCEELAAGHDARRVLLIVGKRPGAVVSQVTGGR